MPAENCPGVLMFNNSKAPFNDSNLRLAISYALNYEQFKSLFASEGAKIPNRSFAPSTLTGYKDTEQLETNLTKAEELMNKSGYNKVGSFYQKNGTDLSFTLTVRSDKQNHKDYSEVVKTQLEDFGIKVNLEIIDSAMYNAKTSHKFAGAEGITMQACIMGYTAAGMADLGSKYINGNDEVQGGAEVYDTDFVNSCDALNAAANLDEFNKAAGEIQDFYASSCPAIALLWEDQVFAHSSRISNVTLDTKFGLNNVHNILSLNK